MCYIDDSPSVVTQTNERYSVRNLYTARSKEKTFLGFEELEPLTFYITVFSQDGFTPTQRRLINKWLVGRFGYKKFEVMQDEIINIYYQCIFTEQNTLYVGDKCVGLTLQALCNSPYQNMLPVTVSKPTVSEPDTLIVNNTSDIYDYVLPQMTIKCSGLQTYCSIINTSDDDREFKINNVLANEIFTVNNQTKIMTSDNPTFSFNNFNFKWLRLVNGANTLTLSGISEISITSPVYVRVGA